MPCPLLQVKRCADAGADIVRITVQGTKEAEACMHIRERLFKDRYDTPLVADIHFQPAVAMLVAEAFEKIRINPGGWAVLGRLRGSVVMAVEKAFGLVSSWCARPGGPPAPYERPTTTPPGPPCRPPLPHTCPLQATLPTGARRLT